MEQTSTPKIAEKKKVGRISANVIAAVQNSNSTFLIDLDTRYSAKIYF